MDHIELDFGTNDFKSIDLNQIGQGHQQNNNHQFSRDSSQGRQRVPNYNAGPSLVVRDPPSRDSTFGAELLINKDHQRKSTSPGNSRPNSPISFTPTTNNFSDNMYKKVEINPQSDFQAVDINNLDNLFDDKSKPVDLQPPSASDFNMDLGGLDDLNIGSGVDMSSNNTVQSSSWDNQVPAPKSFEEIQKEKYDILFELERLRERGFRLSRNYTMQSDYEEMKMERDRIVFNKKLDSGVKMQRQMLVSFCTGIEFLNKQFNPVDVYLEGWSEQMMVSVDQSNDYDDIFEELYKKYSQSTAMPPELRLLMMIGGSAAMYHFTSKLFGSVMPGAQDFLRQNPDLARDIQAAAFKTMAKQGQAEAAYAGMMNGFMENEHQTRQARQQRSQDGQYNPMGQPPFSQPEVPRREMNGPSNLDDILDQLPKQNNVKNVNIGGRKGPGIDVDL